MPLRTKNQTYLENKLYYSHNFLQKDLESIRVAISWLAKKLKFDIEYCRNFSEKIRPGIYNKLAVLFVEKKHRHAVRVAFAFARYVDDMVDEVSSCLGKQGTLHNLNLLKKEWEDSKNNRFANTSVICAMRHVAIKYDIPEEFFELFFKAMIGDVEAMPDNEQEGNGPTIFMSNYEELEQYMYEGSSSLALIMTYILDPGNTKARDVAKNIGYAMHLTNLLKDIKHDYEQMGRVYIPQQLIDKFQINIEQLPQVQHTNNWKKLVKTLINKARSYYEEIEKDFDCLSRNSRFTTRITLDLYKCFLDEIEKRDYDVFSQKLTVPVSKKIKIFTKTLISS